MIEATEVVSAALSGGFVFVLVAFAWNGVAGTRNESLQDVSLLPWAFVGAILWHPGLWQALFARALFVPLPGDPFLTLSRGGQIGLVILSVVGGLLLGVLSVRKTRRLRRIYMRRASLLPASLDTLASVVLALVALALAPQLFYLYYGWLTPELPARWLVEGLPSIERLGMLARPRADGTLADHAAALLLWTLAIACLLGWLLDVRRRRRALGPLPAAGIVATLAVLWSLAGTLLAGTPLA